MKKIIFMLLLCFMLSACAGNDSNNNNQMDYEQTKKITVDILKTDEGKKALNEILTDEKMKEKLVIDQAIVKDTIQKTLTSEKGKQFWKKSFEDPKFAEAVAKSMQNEHEALLKKLMSDPEYQEKLIDVMKNPEYQKEMSDALKSKEFRKHLQDVILETFDSPLFKAKVEKILLKAAEEMGTTSETRNDQGQGQGQATGGEDGEQGDGGQDEGQMSEGQ